MRKRQAVKAPRVPVDIDQRKALASAVRELRGRRDITQEGLSTRAGLGINYVSQLERGYHSASWAAMGRLAVALDVPLSELADLYERRLRES